MSYEDLEKFTVKVKQLVLLVDSLNEIPSRRSELASCDNHEQVVELAKAWGFEIGTRWGENKN